MDINRLDARFGAEVTGLDLSPAARRRHPIEDQRPLRGQRGAVLSRSVVRPAGDVHSRRREPWPADAAGDRDVAPCGLRRDRGADQSRHRPARGRQRPPDAGRVLAYRSLQSRSAAEGDCPLRDRRAAAGGNTEFTNLFLAYDALDDATRRTIRGRRVFHAYLSRRAPRKLLTRTKEEERGSSGCWQPLVRRHPESGRSALYLNPMRCDEVEGMDRGEGDALLDRLYAHCDQLRFRYSHRWQPGDVLIWDNRSALHQATFDFDQSQRRYLHRIMLRGDRPCRRVSRIDAHVTLSVVLRGMMRTPPAPAARSVRERVQTRPVPSALPRARSGNLGHRPGSAARR